MVILNTYTIIEQYHLIKKKTPTINSSILYTVLFSVLVNHYIYYYLAPAAPIYYEQERYAIIYTKKKKVIKQPLKYI